MVDHRETLAGIVDSVIFQSDDTGYTVCEIECEDGLPAVLVGTMPYIAEGDNIIALGKWTVHSTYGKQFRVESYEKVLPTSENDILRYLASGAIKGIGPKTAEKIVEKFGSDTFDIIENHHEWLSDIPGISRRKADDINSSFVQLSGARNVMMFCSDYFSSDLSMKIYNKWGGNAIDIIKANPFRLCSEFNGIGFVKADAIAASCGLPIDSKYRIESGIFHLLSNAAHSSGHTCLSRKKLTIATAELLSIDYDKVDETIAELVISGNLFEKEMRNDYYIYDPKMRIAEEYVAQKLLQLNKLCISVNRNDIEGFILKSERESGIDYAPLQKQAIYSTLNNGVSILTGGPGTGKTTIIKGLISIFESIGCKVALAAPTGRAAKRMSETTGYEAKTIHRLLEMEFKSNNELKFVRGASYLLDENVFIIDESSMLDIQIAESFLLAVKPGSRIIFIGDRDQLPSVGAGNILSDLIESEKFSTVCLSEIFRQSENSMIVSAAHNINDGYIPATNNKSEDFFFMGRDNDEAIADTITQLCCERLPKKYGPELAAGIQVITPSRKGVAGTESMNTLLQSVLNPHTKNKPEKKHGSRIFRTGDKVMQIKNNYSVEWEKNGYEGIGIFNGDIGIIESIDLKNENMVINFDDRIVIYEFSMLDELEHAYAITVHKSQGSEYPIVIIPLYRCPPMLMSRNLLYTAVTRAEKMVILVGRKSVLETMVENNYHITRYTGLKEILNEKE
ncbi:MAG: ATP-dependent RecD-like DNA helicase [Clostridia bacterium]|nr:ATP-dependent RecD-like DNA helicase [Clostridia bacterium]